MDIQQKINLQIYRQFEAARIEFAYPTRTIYMNTIAAESQTGHHAAGEE
jgi:small-conductance mechanosensitive channel